MTLSARGNKKAGEPLRPDFALFERATERPYSADDQDGAIPLCIAENLLQWDIMREKLRDIFTTHAWPDWLPSYAPLAGHPDFLAAVAHFVSTHIAGTKLDPGNFCASAGATGVIEVTAMALGDPGDVVVFPAPAYQAYRPDINSKAGMERYDITHYAATFGRDFHPLSVAELDAAHQQLGGKFRMLVLTQPDNPTGAVYSAEQLKAFADWCIEHEVHLIVNEIYALSQFSRDSPDVLNRSPYSSFLPLLERRDSPYLHWWYSFSKDFGLSGIRAGLLYTRSGELRTAYTNYNAPHQVSNLAQWSLSVLLRDDAWVTEFQDSNQRLLTEAYRVVTDTLDELLVDYHAARGSLFVWADFSRFLFDSTPEEAEAFWSDLFEETGLLLTAPGGLGQPEIGWLRIVYSGISTQALREAMWRLKKYLGDPDSGYRDGGR